MIWRTTSQITTGRVAVGAIAIGERIPVDKMMVVYGQDGRVNIVHIGIQWAPGIGMS